MAQPISNLPIGAKVKFGKYQVNTEDPQPIVWTIVAKNHQCTPAYPDNSVTLQTTGVIDVRCFDAQEPLNTMEYLRTYGNARYSLSNIDQWLNKDSAAGEWYVATHEADQSPTEQYTKEDLVFFDQRPGFLHHFSNAEKDSILTTNIDSDIPVDYGQNTSTQEILNRKVFLPSLTEIGFVSTNLLPEGATWQHLKTKENLKKYMTHQLYTNSNSYSVQWSKPNEMMTWQLRSPMDFGHVTRCGGVSWGSDEACHNTGISPALNISATTPVFDTVDSDNCYVCDLNSPPGKPSYITVPSIIYGNADQIITWGIATDPDGDTVNYILERSVNGGAWEQIYKGEAQTHTDKITLGWNTVQYRVCAADWQDKSSEYYVSETRVIINNVAPEISGTDTNLGTKNSGFTHTYTVTDNENDPTTVEERLDGELIRSYVVALGDTNTLTITDDMVLELSNGAHTVTVKATDSFGNYAMRTYTFTKSVGSFSIKNKEPYASDALPTRIRIYVDRKIPDKSTFKVLICNNGFDNNPTWEDATEAIVNGRVYVFENKTKTADKWGVIIKVNVTRGQGEGSCYVSSIRGNFDDFNV